MKNSKPKPTTNLLELGMDLFLLFELRKDLFLMFELRMDLFLLVCGFAERCIWCGTRPPASVLP